MSDDVVYCQRPFGSHTSQNVTVHVSVHVLHGLLRTWNEIGSLSNGLGVTACTKDDANWKSHLQFSVTINTEANVLTLSFIERLWQLVTMRVFKKTSKVYGSFILLAPELFFLILAHSVYKMWIIQEPNTSELWNKLHFEDRKKRRVYTMFKIFSTYICWINI